MFKTLDVLFDILSRKRRHGTLGDLAYRMDLKRQLAPWHPTQLGEGNIVVKIGESRTMFSSHVDTVHPVALCDGSRQKLVHDTVMEMVFLDEKQGCLGADDGNGIFIMLCMIEAGVPGTYVFHTGEEVGGIGSLSLADRHEGFLKQFDRAIAFDRAVRPGCSPEVITHQSSGRCASDEFGQALADALNLADPELGYWPSDAGVFTDTANYNHVIPECTNLGCFYVDQHGPGESVDLAGLMRLVEACLKVDWESLPTKRDPNEVDDFGCGSWGSSQWAYPRDTWVSSKVKKPYSQVLSELTQMWDARVKVFHGKEMTDDEVKAAGQSVLEDVLGLGVGDTIPGQYLLDVALDFWWIGDSSMLKDVVADELGREWDYVHTDFSLLSVEVARDSVRDGVDAILDACVAFN